MREKTISTKRGFARCSGYRPEVLECFRESLRKNAALYERLARNASAC